MRCFFYKLLSGLLSSVYYSVHYLLLFCVYHCLSNHSLMLPFITLEGDRWWITRTFDSGSIQQELNWPSCKLLFLHLFCPLCNSYALFALVCNFLARNCFHCFRLRWKGTQIYLFRATLSFRPLRSSLWRSVAFANVEAVKHLFSFFFRL